MHQIGSRDEARNLGGAGICGRKLCCLHSSGNLPSISIDMARVQQIAHRGSERISGICGRLMCCLSYEAKQYEEMMKGMPQPHSQVKTPEGKGSVVEINPLTSQIKVKLEDGNVITSYSIHYTKLYELLLVGVFYLTKFIQVVAHSASPVLTPNH